MPGLVLHIHGMPVMLPWHWGSLLHCRPGQAHPEVERTQVPIRYDPFDIGTAYVYCRGQWVQCLSQYYQQIHGHSEKELSPPVEGSTYGFPSVNLETVPAYAEYRL